MNCEIRLATTPDRDAIWAILEPIIRAGETYPLPRDMTRDDALAYWLADSHETFVAIVNQVILGTYYIRPNNLGAGNHIANCGYMVSPFARGKGIARAMCKHSLDYAKTRDYTGVQFNFVIANNQHAVTLWSSLGFKIMCRLPQVFNHPKQGMVDALVMFKQLE